jgi:hypothetical protein
MRWRRPPQPRTSRSDAAQCAASCAQQACAGGAPTRGRKAAPRIAPHKDGGRRPDLPCSTDPPDGSTTRCLDEWGPVVPRTVPPAPGWSRSGHRIQAPMDYGRGEEKVWVYGALRVRDGQDVTLTAPARTTAGSLKLLTLLESAKSGGRAPPGQRHSLQPHERARPGVVGECLPGSTPSPSRQTPAGSLCRKAGGGSAVARRSLASPSPTPAEIDVATRVATNHRNARAQPWIWGRPPPPQRTLCRCVVYRL